MHFFLSAILIKLFAGFSFWDEVTSKAQRFLIELGYNTGPIDDTIEN